MNSTDLEKDTGLAMMLAAAQPGDHAVLADWIAEHLNDEVLAQLLRSGQEDPRRAEEHERTLLQGFRYRQIDRYVMLYLSSYQVWGTYQEQREGKLSRGHVLGLCLSPEAPRGPSRLVRWYPGPKPGAGFEGLWKELGKNRPATVEQGM